MTRSHRASNPESSGAPEHGEKELEHGVNEPERTAIELRVRDLAAALQFARVVLRAEVVRSADGAAVLRAGVRGTALEWTLRADRSGHPGASECPGDPLREIVALVVRRGAGVALRVQVDDADAAVARARELDASVLAAASDTEHGTRAATVSDRDGYVWIVEGPASSRAPSS